MNPSDAITIREYIDFRVTALQEFIEERLRGMDKALTLQEEKNEHHFTALNGEQSRLAADRERYLPRELFDREMQNLKAWREDTAKQLAARTGEAHGSSDLWSRMFSVAALLVAVGTLIVLIARSSFSGPSYVPAARQLLGIQHRIGD